MSSLCMATTLKGNPCTFNRKPNSSYCGRHSLKEQSTTNPKHIEPKKIIEPLRGETS